MITQVPQARYLKLLFLAGVIVLLVSTITFAVHLQIAIRMVTLTDSNGLVVSVLLCCFTTTASYTLNV